MIDVGIVHGSAEQAVPLVIGVDTVYVHTDIQEVTKTDPVTGRERKDFQYHEIQYKKDEYILMMAEKNDSLEADLTSTQLALCDVYEMIGG